MINHPIIVPAIVVAIVLVLVVPTSLATEVLSLQTGSFVGQAVLVLESLLWECWLLIRHRICGGVEGICPGGTCRLCPGGTK
jgi:hypothetical protein